MVSDLEEQFPEQVRLLPDPCVVCGREGVVVIRQWDGSFMCVDCCEKESGDAANQVGPSA